MGISNELNELTTNNNTTINNTNTIKNNTLASDTPCTNINDQRQKPVTAVCDSAASNHYFRQQDAWILKDLQKVPPSAITIPDGNDIHSDEKLTLPLDSALSLNSRQASVVPKLKNKSTLSMGPFCDDDCDVWLRKRNLYVIKDNRVILTGYHNYQTGLWDAQLPIPVTGVQDGSFSHNTHPGLYSKQKCNNLQHIPSEASPKKCEKKRRTPGLWPSSFVPSHDLVDDNEVDYHLHHSHKQDMNEYCPVPPFQEQELNVVIHKNTTKTTLANFLHQAVFAPKKSTFIRVIHNNQFTTFPGLDSTLVSKHLPPSVPTALGHIKQERQGLQSTKTTQKLDPDDDFFHHLIHLIFERMKLFTL